MKRIHIFIACLALILTGIKLDASENYPQIEIVTTSGTIVVELDRNRAPKTVENFLNYDQSGAYVGTIFHRVIPGFVIQTGGYDVNLNEIDTLPEIINESGNGLKNQRMSLGMARTNELHSGSSQFYINLNDNFSVMQYLGMSSMDSQLLMILRAMQLKQQKVFKTSLWRQSLFLKSTA